MSFRKMYALLDVLKRIKWCSSSSSSVRRGNKVITTKQSNINGVVTEEQTVADAQTGQVLEVTVNGQPQEVAGSIAF